MNKFKHRILRFLSRKTTTQAQNDQLIKMLNKCTAVMTKAQDILPPTHEYDEMATELSIMRMEIDTYINKLKYQSK